MTRKQRRRETEYRKGYRKGYRDAEIMYYYFCVPKECNDEDFRRGYYAGRRDRFAGELPEM